MYRRIIVLSQAGVDNGPAGRRAVALAAPGASVWVLELVHQPLLEGYFGHPELYESLRQNLVRERQGAVDQAAASIAGQGLEATATAVWSALQHEVLAQQVRDYEADLVVVSLPAAGRRAVRKLWHCVAASPASVLVVRGDADQPYRRIVAAVDPFHAHGKPAVLDDVVLSSAADIVSGREDISLRVVHAYVPLHEFLPASHLEQVQVGEAERVVESNRRDALLQVIRQAGLPDATAQLQAAAPDDVLETLATDGSTDLLIMGAWSRGRLHDLFLGSTTERVLEKSTADVLVVKPTDGHEQ
jgi:universal stress protein E